MSEENIETSVLTLRKNNDKKSTKMQQCIASTWETKCKVWEVKSELLSPNLSRTRAHSRSFYVFAVTSVTGLWV